MNQTHNVYPKRNSTCQNLEYTLSNFYRNHNNNNIHNNPSTHLPYKSPHLLIYIITEAKVSNALSLKHKVLPNDNM